MHGYRREPGPVLSSASRLGGRPGPTADAAQVRADGSRLTGVGQMLFRLQRDAGNQYVGRLLGYPGAAAGSGPVIQASLLLGAAHDRYEQEADRVARQALSGRGQDLSLPARPAGSAPGGAVGPEVSHAIISARGGRHMPRPVRTAMERALGADFGAVRLHTDARADQLNRLLGARAFTTGQEIFFRRGEYRPQEQAGRKLLAHELTHVLQQEPSGQPGPAAGVIQRMKITIGDQEYDTEDRSQLRRLRAVVDEMTDLGQVEEMLGRIEREGAGQPGAQTLAENLREQRGFIVRAAQREARRRERAITEGAPLEPVVTARQPRRREVPPQPVAPQPVAAVPEAQPSPARQEQTPEQARADVRAIGEAVLERAAKLKTSGTDLPADTGAWLRDYALFDEQRIKWSQAATQATSHIVTSRAATEHQRQVRDAISGAETTKWRVDRAEEQQRRAQELAGKRAAMLAQRKREAADLAGLIDKYADPDLEFKVEPARPAQTEDYQLLLRWLFGMALRQLEESGDKQIGKLARHLATLRAARRNDLGGPGVKLTARIDSHLARGQARSNGIEMSLGLPSTDPVALLADGTHEVRLISLVTELATGFIHETAHLWQLAKYENDSHPWKSSFSSDRNASGDPGIPFNLWTKDAKLAYQEFMGGGILGQAKGDPEWQRLSKAIEAPDYYMAGSRDRRGRELVSHLIELVYNWRLPQSFADVFPQGSALIDLVLADS